MKVYCGKLAYLSILCVVSIIYSGFHSAIWIRIQNRTEMVTNFCENSRTFKYNFYERLSNWINFKFKKHFQNWENSKHFPVNFNHILKIVNGFMLSSKLLNIQSALCVYVMFLELLEFVLNLECSIQDLSKKHFINKLDLTNNGLVYIESN